MNRLLATLAAIVDAILAWRRRSRRASEQTQSQAERDAIENDPAGWYSDHFNGMHEHASTNTTAPDKTNSETDRAP